MDIDELRKLVEFMEQVGLVELEVDAPSGKVRLVREGKRATDTSSRATAESDEGAAATPRALAVEPLAITSPMVGTFYRSSIPGGAAFASEGDVVQVGQVVCIIEAMKVMNEILAEVSGRIIAIPVENGSPVEYGTPLFLLHPLDGGALSD